MTQLQRANVPSRQKQTWYFPVISAHVNLFGNWSDKTFVWSIQIQFIQATNSLGVLHITKNIQGKLLTSHFCYILLIPLTWSQIHHPFPPWTVCNCMYLRAIRVCMVFLLWKGAIISDIEISFTKIWIW